MSTPYGKPWLSMHDQAELLESRGLVGARSRIDDLAHFGYYRLSGYWYPFRALSPDGERLDHFFEGTTFDDVLAIHHFDTELRDTVWRCISHIELHLRVAVGYELGRLGSFAHLDRAVLDERTANQKFDQFRKSLANLQARSKEDFVQHHERHYEGQMPVWVATEIMQLGQLVTLYEMTPFECRAAIADHFGARADELRSWLKAINIVRNVVAHHGRLWNRAIGMKPQLNRRKQEPLLDHARASVDRVYGTLAVIAYLLRHDDRHDLVGQLRHSVEQFPSIRTLSPDMMMLPENWQDLPLWSAPPTLISLR